MDEQEEDSVEHEVAPVETETNELTEEDNSEQVQEPTEKELEQERNWRAMRQRQKEMEYEIKQKNEMLDRFLSVQNNSQPQKVEVEDPIDPDDFANYSGVEKVTRRNMQPLEKKIQDLEAKIAQQEQSKMIGNLRNQYSDFDDIVNVETLEILEKTEPELAATIAEFKDPYKMGIQSYKYIKALGLADKVPSARRVKEVTKKIEKNSKTVQSPQAFDKRPIAQAYVTSAADNKRLYEEMMHYAGKAGGL